MNRVNLKPLHYKMGPVSTNYITDKKESHNKLGIKNSLHLNRDRASKHLFKNTVNCVMYRLKSIMMIIAFWKHRSAYSVKQKIHLLSEP